MISCPSACPSVRPSVRPSVCNVAVVDCDHTRWNSSKIISRMISLGTWLSADPNIMDILQREHPKFSRNRSLLLLSGELLAERCRTDDLMPSIPVSCLPPCCMDPKVQGMDVLIYCSQPGGSWATNGPPPVCWWS